MLLYFLVAEAATAAEPVELNLSDWIRALLIAASYKREIKEVVVVEPAEEAPKDVDAASNVSIAGSSTSSPTAPKAKNRLYTCPLDQVRDIICTEMRFNLCRSC